MLRFYLQIKDGTYLIRDEEGVDLPSAAHARAEGPRLGARAMRRRHPGREGTSLRMPT